MNRDLLTGLIATIVFHGIAVFAVFPVSKPHYEVIVSPSVLEVSLVSTLPSKEIREISLPEPGIEQPVIVEIEEPEMIFEKKEPESVEDVVEEVIEEPEDILEQEPESVEEEVQRNTKQGANIDAIPLINFNKPPDYPREARRKGWEGRVVLSVLISREGRVVSLNVIESSGHGILDQASLIAVRQWLFEPAQLFGNPIEKRLEVPVRFRLENKSGSR